MPTTDIEIKLERLNEDPITFEKLSADILQKRGYVVEKTTEGIGSDGGKDIILRRGDKKGIGHVSARKDWGEKIDENAKEMNKGDKGYDFMVFVTNQKPTPPVREEEKEQEIEAQYGWPTTIISQGTLRSMLTAECPELATNHLGVNPAIPAPNPVNKIKELRDKRIQRIKSRTHLPNELPPGPCIVFHLFPVGMFSMDYDKPPASLPSPPFFGSPRGMSEPRGNGVVSKNSRLEGQHPDYVYLSEKGYIEAVSTEYFQPKTDPSVEVEGIIDPEIDAAIRAMFESCLSCLEEIGAKTPIYAYISLIDVEGYVMDDRRMGNQLIPMQRTFPEDYKPKGSVIDSLENVSLEALRPSLDRIWHEAGRKNGSPWLENIDEGP